MKSIWRTAMMLLIALGWQAMPADAGTLDAVRHAGQLACGTVQNADDWDAANVHGDLSAFEGEICQALAAAIFGDTGKVRISAFPSEAGGFTALQSGAVAVVIGLSPSVTTATHYAVQFGRPVFFDSQRVLVSKQSGIAQLANLKDHLVCALDLSPPERTLHDVMTSRGVPYALMTHSEQGEMDAAIAVRHCVAGTGMESRLAQSRANFHALTSDFVFLPERLTLSPVVPATRYGDQNFSLIVDWTVNALIEAEALGITRANVTQTAKHDDLRIEQFSGRDFATAQALGLDRNWAIKVIAATGNYGEVFERTVGHSYHLERGLNALWTEHGLMYPMPMQ